MNKLTLECEIITPMFLAGADGRTAELRAPSIKGAMRFWWRAMNGNLKLNELKVKESDIFGGTEEKQGKSKIIIKVKNDNFKKSTNSFPFQPIKTISKGKEFNVNILEYLAYGPVERKSIVKREYIKDGEKFIVDVNIFESSLVENIKEIFKIISTFGGLGSRSRNGFGSFKILSINKVKMNYYIDINNYEFVDELAPYTAFSKRYELWETKGIHDTWDKALAELGKAYKEARGKIENRHFCEIRQYICAPINVGNGRKSFLERHAKPYFMSIHREDDNKYSGSILFLPYDYTYACEIGGIPKERGKAKYLDACNKLNVELSKHLRPIRF